MKLFVSSQIILIVFLASFSNLICFASNKTPNKTLSTTQEYFEASNRHDLEQIASLLSDNVVYQSNGVGSHNGKAEVIKMISSFFNQYPEVNWVVTNNKVQNSNAILRFEMCLDEDALPISGTERVHVGEDGLIDGIYVTRD